MTNKKLGFTLIELLVVIAIIGILSSVVLASLNSARAKARDARRISDVKQIQLALELYYDANREYPADLTVAGLVTPGYISAIPTDPSTNLAYYYAGITTDSATASTCETYHLGATLETANPVSLGSDSDVTAISTFGASAADCGNAGANFTTGADPVYDVRP